MSSDQPKAYPSYSLKGTAPLPLIFLLPMPSFGLDIDGQIWKQSFIG